MLSKFFQTKTRAATIVLYRDIGRAVLDDYDLLIAHWPTSGLPAPDFTQYLQLRDRLPVRQTFIPVGYEDFKDLYKTGRLFLFQDPERCANAGFLFTEREAMRRTIEQSRGNADAYVKVLQAYGTLCGLDDDDYLYARLAALPDTQGLLATSIRIRSHHLDRQMDAHLPLDPGFMTIYLEARQRNDALIAAVHRPPSWRVPDMP